MRIRHAEFAMVPTWLLRLPDVRGDGTRIAVYVAVRIAAFEQPEHDWRSDRELSVYLGELIGIGHDAVRKHLTALRRCGAIQGTGGDIVLPSDPESGDRSGDGDPQSGDGDPQSGDGDPQSPLLVRVRDRERSLAKPVLAVPTPAGSPSETDACGCRYDGHSETWHRCGDHGGGLTADERRRMIPSRVPPRSENAG